MMADGTEYFLDEDSEWQELTHPLHLPAGGQTGQLLVKNSDGDGDAGYITLEKTNILYGSGAPNLGIGQLNDVYIDIDTGINYRKEYFPGGDIYFTYDNFTLPDNDPPDPIRWTVDKSPDVGFSQEVYIDGERLYCHQQGSSVGANNYWSGVFSRFNISGDFDVEVQLPSWVCSDNRGQIELIAAKVSDGGTVANIHLNSVPEIRVRAHSDGNYRSATISPNDQGVIMRIKRTGAQIEFLYKPSGAGSYTTLWTQAAPASEEDVLIWLRSFVYDQNSTSTAYFDNFKVHVGTIVQPPGGTLDWSAFFSPATVDVVESMVPAMEQSHPRGPYSDLFEGANGSDPSSAMWVVNTTDPDDFLEIQDNALRFSSNTPAASGSSLNSKFQLEGDFEVEVHGRVDRVETQTPSSGAHIFSFGIGDDDTLNPTLKMNFEVPTGWSSSAWKPTLYDGVDNDLGGFVQTSPGRMSAAIKRVFNKWYYRLWNPYHGGWEEWKIVPGITTTAGVRISLVWTVVNTFQFDYYLDAVIVKSGWSSVNETGSGQSGTFSNPYSVGQMVQVEDTQQMFAVTADGLEFQGMLQENEQRLPTIFFDQGLPPVGFGDNFKGGYSENLLLDSYRWDFETTPLDYVYRQNQDGLELSSPNGTSYSSTAFKSQWSHTGDFVMELSLDMSTFIAFAMAATSFCEVNFYTYSWKHNFGPPGAAIRFRIYGNSSIEIAAIVNGVTQTPVDITSMGTTGDIDFRISKSGANYTFQYRLNHEVSGGEWEWNGVAAGATHLHSASPDWEEVYISFFKQDSGLVDITDGWFVANLFNFNFAGSTGYAASHEYDTILPIEAHHVKGDRWIAGDGGTWICSGHDWEPVQNQCAPTSVVNQSDLQNFSGRYGQVIKHTLDANLNLCNTVRECIPGGRYIFIFKQAPTGGPYTVTLGSQVDLGGLGQPTMGTGNSHLYIELMCTYGGDFESLRMTAINYSSKTFL